MNRRPACGLSVPRLMWRTFRIRRVSATATLLSAVTVSLRLRPYPTIAPHIGGASENDECGFIRK